MMPEKPKPKPKLKPKQGATTSQSQESFNQLKVSDTSFPALSSDAQSIPLMFRAKDRTNIQFAGDPESALKWVEEWLEGCPPQPEKVDESIPIWKKKPVQAIVKLPQFGAHVKSWKYQIRWRMVTNGGQDEGLIRPVIGSKGMPFFPGSSMKGAFRNACPKEKRQLYCGGEVKDEEGNKVTKPGILRFHGGYPVDMAWAETNRLVDIAHGQQPYQVMRNTKETGENANVQISLYQPEFRFGISSPQISPDSKEWDEIKKIWETALGYGIGSRVSAGYGYVKEVQLNNDRVLASVYLNGEGVSSQLLLKATTEDKYKTPEFRPNMFKAALRGHTLRILGGLIDEKNAKQLTQKIWGGIAEKAEDNEAIVGRVGIDFSIEGKLQQEEHIYTQINNNGREFEVRIPTYKLSNGRLSLVCIGEVKVELETFLINLIKFSVLFGGFGKSWRRIHHGMFYPSYFQNKNKPMIGCHWELTTASQHFLINPNPDLHGITSFIENIREQAISWIKSELGNYQAGYAQDWREAWNPKKVEVWAKTTNVKRSRAVSWFHGNYQGQNKISKSVLTGERGKIGRIWHRMYPVENGFVELLTIFPDESVKTKDFLDFLNSNSSGFSLLWGSEQ